jgi:hypothetical protein
MLFTQFGDGRPTKITTKFGFKFTGISGSRTKEYSENADRIDRLERVVYFLREKGNLGTLETPNEYIEDSIPMAALVLKTDRKDTVAYYTGEQGNTIIGIGGSMKHVYGAGPSRSSEPFGSSTFAILAGLRSELETKEKGKGPDTQLGLSAVQVFSKEIIADFPKENMVFMAKRLAMEKRGKQTVILATPIYVAMNDSNLPE